ncbi:hypothetical protein GmRootV59_22910 [Variovorax sp. V59]
MTEELAQTLSYLDWEPATATPLAVQAAGAMSIITPIGERSKHPTSWSPADSPGTPSDTTSTGLASSPSPSKTDTIESLAQAQTDLAAIQTVLRSARSQGRQLSVDLDSTSRAMVHTMAGHQKALQAAIRIAEVQWTNDLAKARKSLLVALAAPCAIVIVLTLLVVVGAAWWSTSQISTARTKVAQLEARTQELTRTFCLTPAGRKSCRPRDAASEASR